MDPRRLMVFRAVAHERSFSRAAENLSLSQPSVSHQIALLETEIGVRVFDRDRGRAGLRLTHAGEVLLEHADQVGWRLELADAQTRRPGHRAPRPDPRGRLPDRARRLRAVRDQAPARDRRPVRVLLGEVTSSTLEPRFLSGEFDVALGYQEATEQRRELQGAERIDLFQDTMLIGIPPQHRLAGPTGPITLAEFADDDWIVPSTDGFLVKACHDAGFEPRIVSTTRDPVATRGLIARGIGVGWVPSLLIDDYAGVAIRPPATPIGRRDIYALLPPGERHPLARHIIRALKDTASDFATTENA